MTGDWRPNASPETLRRRAGLLRQVRAFFDERGVLEVETPALAAHAVTELHIHSLSASGPITRDAGYLQTSPEDAMKRLLASGIGPIYEIAKVFRDGEAGPRHNLEFTMLEWYRPGFDHRRLIDEVDELLAATLGTGPGERLSYREAFERHVGIDPHRASPEELSALASPDDVRGLPDGDRDSWLQWLFATRIEPQLGIDRPAYVFDFPASQAALARIRPGSPPLAERFEVFVRGVELANGYHEETRPAELRRRFEADRAERRRRGLPDVALDERFLAAHESGLPACAGVALGFDRLVMLAIGSASIGDVLTFSSDRA